MEKEGTVGIFNLACFFKKGFLKKCKPSLHRLYILIYGDNDFDLMLTKDQCNG